MPWKVFTTMRQREEFIRFATAADANVAELCRRYGVSRKTGYKWIARARARVASAAPIAAGGADRDAALPAAGVCLESFATEILSCELLTERLADRSRRPHHSPTRTDDDVEKRIVELRRSHGAWGARKLKRRLENLGYAMPAASVVHDVLRRHALIDPAEAQKHRPVQRFERAEPNDLWQMDFKGHFPLDTGGRCHPLTALDDHSRFNLILRACPDERLQTVQSALIDAFRQYGLPRCLLSDNGPPWGSFGNDNNWTRLGVWTVRLGIRLIHGRPNHPQTQGKEERFHRTLNTEVVGTRRLKDLPESQSAFDAFRPVYNHQRPHEALGMAVPASRYRPSPRAYPQTLPTVEYGPTDAVRRVDASGKISFGGRPLRVGTAFSGEPVAVRATSQDGLMAVYYAHQEITRLDLRQNNNESGGQ